MPHIYYTYRAANSSILMPSVMEHETSREEAESALMASFAHSATPIVNIVPPFTNTRQIRLLRRHYFQQREDTPASATGMRAALDEAIKALDDDGRLHETSERIRSRQVAAEEWQKNFMANYEDTEQTDAEKALMVFLLTNSTRDWLAANDPQALKQAQLVFSLHSWENYLAPDTNES